MKRKFHVSQSIRGALNNWDKDTWKMVAKDNNMTVNALKERFRIMDFEGKKVLPMHDECEGFSYINGCPGHIISDKEES